MKTKEEAAAEYAKKVGGDAETQAMAGTDFMEGWRFFDEEEFICTHSMQILAATNRKEREMHEMFRPLEKWLFTASELDAMICDLRVKADNLNVKYPNQRPIVVEEYDTLLMVRCGFNDIARLYMTRCKRWR